MGATFNAKASDRTRYGLIGLLAIQRARAIQQRRAQEAAENKADGEAETRAKRPKKRGWFS